MRPELDPEFVRPALWTEIRPYCPTVVVTELSEFKEFDDDEFDEFDEDDFDDEFDDDFEEELDDQSLEKEFGHVEDQDEEIDEELDGD